MTMTTAFDAIVLGAGAMGSASAYHLTKAGLRVLLLEQFEIDHQKGSSYGYSRIIRYAYDHIAYIALSRAVYPMWFELEEESGERLYTRSGGLDLGRADQSSLNRVIQCLRETGIPHDTLTPSEAQKRFPQFRFDDDMTVVYQADTGILAASKCVRTHVRLAKEHGATVLANMPVMSVTVNRDDVEVQTAAETYHAAKLIITAGSWAKSVLTALGLDLPLTPMRCQEVYFETENPADYEPERFPAFIGHMLYAYDRMPYGIASNLNSGLKVGFHKGEAVHHPSEVNYAPDDAEVERATGFARRYLTGVNGVRSTRICLYTMTSDEHFVIDQHPEYPHVVVGAGFSGHGFKFSTLIGSILTDLALRGETPHDISLFRASRFF